MYIKFYDAMYAPSAIILSGHLLYGWLVMVKPLEVEKNLHIQSNASVQSLEVFKYHLKLLMESYL